MQSAIEDDQQRLAAAASMVHAIQARDPGEPIGDVAQLLKVRLQKDGATALMLLAMNAEVPTDRIVALLEKRCTAAEAQELVTQTDAGGHMNALMYALKEGRADLCVALALLAGPRLAKEKLLFSALVTTRKIALLSALLCLLDDDGPVVHDLVFETMVFCACNGLADSLEVLLNKKKHVLPCSSLQQVLMMCIAGPKRLDELGVPVMNRGGCRRCAQLMVMHGATLPYGSTYADECELMAHLQDAVQYALVPDALHQALAHNIQTFVRR